MKDISEYKTLYHTLCDTVAAYPDRAAYCVPPMEGRSYYPDGWELKWNQVFAEVEAKKIVYAKAGVGHGHLSLIHI